MIFIFLNISGSYCNDTALTAPTGLCTAGYFCVVGSDNHAPEICTAGRYCPEGSHTPTRCPAGTFSNTTGLTAVEECTNCTKGSYCQSTGLTDVEGNCTQGYYCPEGMLGLEIWFLQYFGFIVILQIPQKYSFIVLQRGSALDMRKAC